MNKQVFVFIILFIALCNAQNGYVFNANCDVNVTGCAEIKADCTGPTNSSQQCYFPGNGTIIGSCCADNLWCISGTCQRNNYGSACTSVSSCLTDADGTLAVGCNSGQCTELYGAGDTCTNNTSCIGNLTCSNTTNTCTGLSLGATCNSTWIFTKISDCAAPNYCAQNINGSYVCTAPLAAGASCSSSGQACNQVQICNSGTCVGIGSVASGGKATNVYACENGLILLNGTCQTPLGGDLISCTQNSDCLPYWYNTTNGNNTIAHNSTCECYPQSGNSYCNHNESYGAGVQSTQLNTLATCLQTNNCSYNGNSALGGNPTFNANSAPNSCSYVNCWSAYKKFAGETCSDQDNKFGSCFYSPECGGFPVWAIVVIVIVAVILVLAVVVVIFLVLRRRKDYASI